MKILSWGRPGFDVGADAGWGMSSTSQLVNPLEKLTANDESFALAA